MQAEHPKYFEALNKHPRLLVGQQVPGLNGKDTETLRDAEDAKDWQEAVKSILVEEVRERATKAMDENAGVLQTVHASIDLFRNNADLVPGAKEFDVDLANRFVAFAAPYELRVEGKLQGYTIAVQPIIDQLREQLLKERSASAAPAAAAASPSTVPAAAATPAAPPEEPQAGIQSKAGAGGDGAEDFSTLFGTIGLPHLQI